MNHHQCRTLSPLAMSDFKTFPESPPSHACAARESHIVRWVATEIVMAPNFKQRCSIVANFIAACEHSHDHRDMMGLTALVKGLQHPAVARLTKTWAALPSRVVILSLVFSSPLKKIYLYVYLKIEQNYE